jgi:inositol-phosphate phosphatase / L-galactose 1-phosphate phosphatase / histidinol-phosphatase
MKSCPKEFLRIAAQLADVGGEVHQRYFRTPIEIERKQDGSAVTRADREVETVIRDVLARRYPAHGVVGEEYPEERKDAEFVWFIDPIDGTDAFLDGLPLFGLLLALAWRGRVVLGMIDQPILRERWLGADGHGTTLNGQPARTRPCSTLQAATLYADGPRVPATEADGGIGCLRAACKQSRYGADCYIYGLLASGHIDVVADYGLDAHDFLPLAPVVRNAGGDLTDWHGREVSANSDGAIVAVGDTRLLAKAISELRCDTKTSR